MAPHAEPPFQLGDGMDLSGYLLGKSPTSPRSEILIEAHQQGSTDGHGNALIVGDWKLLLRSGAGWPSPTSGRTHTYTGWSDGWYGGVNSSDPAHDSYGLPSGSSSQPWIVKCPALTAGKNYSAGYACMSATPTADSAEYACLFDIKADPCEQTDLSGSHPDVVQKMLSRLSDYRASSVVSTDVMGTTDPSSCATATQHYPGCGGASAEAPMSCNAISPCENPAD